MSSRQVLEDPHSKSVEEVLAFYKVELGKGLTTDNVDRLRKSLGANIIEAVQKKGVLAMVMEQFEDLLVQILLGAAGVSFLLAVFAEEVFSWGGLVEPFVILLILFGNAVVSVWQELSAQSSLTSLEKLQSTVAKVLRNGEWKVITRAELVPGDVIQIRVGDKVPADCRVAQLQSTTCRIEESSLTGESHAIMKSTEVVSDKDCGIQDKVNCVFAGTFVTVGQATCIVTAIGMKTEIGKIQLAVEEAAGEETKTPLQETLEEFGTMLSKVIAVICLVVWLVNYKHFSDPIHGSFFKGCVYYFKISIALAVAAIPEGLPAVITTSLALGTRRMAKRNAIVRKLMSVETLGCTTVICSDKTGTLTTNEMCVVKLAIMSEREEFDIVKFEGTTFNPHGKATLNDKELHIKDNRALQVVAKICSLTCDVYLERVGVEKFIKHGDSTEAALYVAVEKLGCPNDMINNEYLVKDRLNPNFFNSLWRAEYKTLAVLEFTRERKSMSVLVKDVSTDERKLLVKGAPELLLDRCVSLLLKTGEIIKLTPLMRRKILLYINSYNEEGLRTIALAYKLDLQELNKFTSPSCSEHVYITDPDTFVDIEDQLIFVGLAGMTDPPRDNVEAAIDECFSANIRVMMITGDNKITAESVGKKIGLYKYGNTISVTGKEFGNMKYADKVKCLTSTRSAIFSRTEPKHKQEIIKILKKAGEVTAMTGDGVNDAPALKQADIGIAMGISGTEVAKEASDMILADDNFSSVVNAIEEGRCIYNNMKAFIRYLISSNIGEVVSIFLTALFGIPEGLAPVQLLWVNLVTDGPPATALGFNPPDGDVMLQPPRSKSEKLIPNVTLLRYFLIGLYVGFATIGIFVYWYTIGIAGNVNTLVTFKQLRNWQDCHKWTDFNPNIIEGMSDDPCSYFTKGKIKASSLSLTVLVVIEMLNALNALSEKSSLLVMPPWRNPSLLVATSSSIIIHLAILYIPPLSNVFGVAPLSLSDWLHVLYWSLPVILIDEVFKMILIYTSRKNMKITKSL